MLPPVPPSAGLPLARLAFRPFFLLAAIFGILALGAWLAFWHGTILLRPDGGLLWWHQHEMIFGFAAAVVAGFLLTAVQNWTARRGLHGMPLLGLVGIWLAARWLLAFPGDLPSWLPVTLDVAFLPLVALALGWHVVAARQWRNLGFVPLLLLLMVANLAMHLGGMAGDIAMVREAGRLGVLLIVALMVLLGGRVIPFFTARKLQRPQPMPMPWLEPLVLATTLGLVGLQLLLLLGVEVPRSLLGWTLLLAAAANVVRLARWGGHRTWREPLLWGLHLSYAFILVGWVMWALALAGAWRVELAVHALTIGGIGAMMLAMMARVALGHTGREIRTLPGIGLALGLLFGGALLRAPVLALFPRITHWTYSLSIVFWCLAFAIFLFHYVRPLLTARVDGKEG